MVSLPLIKSANASFSSTVSGQLVAVFVGATSGIGEATLKKFAFYSRHPRAYFIGRSQSAADRIRTECEALNPDGEYIFIKADVSLIRVVDQVCNEIKSKEKSINILFLSCGVPSFDRSVTTEGLHLLAALNYYSRLRFITSLLPMLQQAKFLRRVVTVGGGTLEGPLDTSDFPALHVPVSELRGHLSTLITLGLETVAKIAPDVSFVHDYPGTVDTPFLRYMSDELLRSYKLLSVDESGERHFYLATNASFPPAINDWNDWTDERGDGLATAPEIAEDRGNGIYTMGPECDGPEPKVQNFLGEMKKKGIVEQVWRHTEEEFSRIVGHES